MEKTSSQSSSALAPHLPPRTPPVEETEMPPPVQGLTVFLHGYQAGKLMSEMECASVWDAKTRGVSWVNMGKRRTYRVIARIELTVAEGGAE